MSKLILCTIREYHRADIHLQITRTGQVPGWKVIRDLAPSKELFYQYRRWVNAGQWPAKWPEYVAIFEQEMAREPMKGLLKLLVQRLKEGKSIALACYCQDVKYCHRFIIGKWVAAQGFEVVGL